MKKVFIVGAMALIAALAAAPIYLGGAIQKDIHTSIEQLNGMPGYNVAITEYTKGWLNSEAKINIAYDVAMFQSLNDPQVNNEFENKTLAAMGKGITFALNARHGLVNFKGAPRLALADIYITLDESNADVIQPLLDKLQEKYTVQELLVIDAYVSLLGGGVFNITIPVMTSNVDNAAFKFAGLESAGTFLNKGRGYDFSGVFGEIEIGTPEFILKTSDIVLEGDGTMSDKIWMSYGSSTIRMGSLSILAPNTKPKATELTLTGFVINTDVKPSGDDMLDMLMDVDIEQLVMPEYAVSNIDYDFSFNNLRESALVKFYEQIEQLQEQENNSPQAVMDSMKHLAKGFVSAGPELVIDKVGYIIDEKNYLSMEGRVIVDPVIADQAIGADNFQAILTALSGNITMEFGEQLFNLMMTENIKSQLASMDISPEQKAQKLAEQTANIVQMSKQFVDQGMLQKINNGYRVDLTYKNSEPLINGNPFNMF